MRLQPSWRNAPGASMTEAVTEALREKLATVRAQALTVTEATSREQRRANIRALAKTIRDGVGLENLRDPGEFLYDELGLPK